MDTATSVNLLHILQLILHGTAVTTLVSIAPSHDRSIAKNGCKSTVSGLDLLHILQLTLRSPAGTTVPTTTPGHD